VALQWHPISCSNGNQLFRTRQNAYPLCAYQLDRKMTNLHALTSAQQDSSPEPSNVGDLISLFLEANGVESAFGVISIHNMPILDAFARRGNIRFVPSRGEAGAVNMADSYARVSNGLSVALTSTGTAAGNAAGAMVEALTAGSPVLHITGQIEVEHVDKNRAYIHESPAQLDMLKAVSKSAYRISRPEDTIAVLQQAVTDALTFPRGPVSVEIPIDVQQAPIELINKDELLPLNLELISAQQDDITAVATALKQAKRPMIMLGGGAKHAQKAARALADMGIGIVTSTNGRAVVAEDHPMSLGAFNVSTYIQDLYASVDFMIVVGSRLRSNETWTYKLKLPSNLTIVDCDQLADQRCYPNEQFVHADSKLFLEALVEEVKGSLDIDSGFAADLAQVRETSIAELKDAIGPYAEIVDVLQEEMPVNACWVRDVTISNSMWGNRLLKIAHPQAGVHAMGGGIGQGLPMAIGASIASDEQVIALSGDGGLSLCMGELMTAAEEQANFTMLLMNDKGYGVIRNIQDAVYGGRRHYSDILVPQFDKLAEATGIKYFYVDSVATFRTVLKQAMAESGPKIVEIDMIKIGPFTKPFAGPPTKTASSSNQIDEVR
jgi:acetolactate synthase-1/2/3 large subunit